MNDMDEQNRGPKDIETSERVATLAKASADAMKHKSRGEHETEHGARYTVPLSEVDAITRYDGSCLVDRTAGEAGARCDSEAANLITLNLMDEIVGGRKSVEEAREVYAENIAAYTMGRPAPYAEQFQFAVPQGGTEDPDESMMAGAMARQAVGKIKDVLTGSEEERSP
jgi:hypothetical protein